MARKGTLAGQKPEKKVTVPSIFDMSLSDILSHCRARHKTMRYLTTGEHEAHHRLFPAKDHSHTDRSREESPSKTEEE